MSEELKIVIVLKESRASVGIQGSECDPVLSLVNGTLPEILAAVPALVDQAHAQWTSGKRYPKCETKLEPATVRTSTASRTAPQPAQSANKPRLF
jgi:hypothetical protein